MYIIYSSINNKKVLFKLDHSAASCAYSDIVLVGWDLQHEGLNCQHWQVTIKRGHRFQCFLSVAKK